MAEVFLGICQADLSRKGRYWLHAACTLSQRFLILTRPPSLNKLLEEVRICMPTRTIAKRCHPSDLPPSALQDPYRNLPDQLAISAIRTIFVALRVGAKYSGDGPFNRILPLSFVICVEIQTCSYWTALEGVRTLPFLPQHPFLPVLHWFRRSLYGHPFQATTHAVIQILTRLVKNLCYYYYSKSISGMKQHRLHQHRCSGIQTIFLDLYAIHIPR